MAKLNVTELKPVTPTKQNYFKEKLKMKKLSAILLSLVLCLSFAACGKSENKTKTDKSEYKVGIIQYMSHPSLDNCYKGIVEALDESGIKYTADYQTGSSNSADSDCVNFAKNMVASKCDVIFAIATPAAKAAFAATDDTDIPVIFCAVNDPVASELVESMEKPGYACTGTSDVLDLKAQVDLIQSMQPEAKKIGILYTSSEDNSISNLKKFKDICGKRGLTVVDKAVQGASDIPAAAEDLASKVDCINNFTDNNVVNNLSVVLSAAEKNNIPVYGSEEEQVKNGCLASMSIDYKALGKVTGNMAADVLKGKDASKMAVKTISEATPLVNTDVLSKLKMTMPEKYSSVQTVTTNK